MKIYSTKEAAEYLEIALPTLKSKVWTKRLIAPDGYIGRNPYFTQGTLDNLKAGNHTNVPADPAPLGSVEAAKRMNITAQAFHQMELLEDGKIGNAVYFWPQTIEKYGKRRYYPYYTMQEATEYLGLPWSTLKHHIYTTRFLKPDNANDPEQRTNLFSAKTLDKFAKLYNSKRTAHTATPPG